MINVSPLSFPPPHSQRTYLNLVGAAYFDVQIIFSPIKDDASHVMDHVPGVRGIYLLPWQPEYL